MSVEHVIIDNIDELYQLHGSKYIQSDVSFIYKAIEKELISGRFVLFSGTPCQIAGLKSFLQKEYDNLLCIAVVCHGVGSLLYWNKYLTSIKKRIGQKIRKVSLDIKTENDLSLIMY